VTDHAADRGATDCSDSAATGKNGTRDTADAGADRGVLVLRRHTGTTAQTEQYRRGNHTCCKPVHRFHDNTSFSNFGYEKFTPDTPPYLT
jgi:hypothetical protein